MKVVAKNINRSQTVSDFEQVMGFVKDISPKFVIAVAPVFLLEALDRLKVKGEEPVAFFMTNQKPKILYLRKLKDVNSKIVGVAEWLALDKEKVLELEE